MSLAPLRYSGPPPFLPPDCFKTAPKVKSVVSRAEQNYLKGTWARRWMLRLALWVGFLATVGAVLILATGRRLTNR